MNDQFEHLNRFSAKLTTAECERDEARVRLAAAVTAINATNVLTCAYCGQEYPPGSPAHGAAVLTEHIRVCDKHPMRALEAEIANTIAIAADAIGTDPAYRSLACVAVLADRAKGLEQRLARIEFDARRREQEAFRAGVAWGHEHPDTIGGIEMEEKAELDRRYPEVTP